MSETGPHRGLLLLAGGALAGVMILIGSLLVFVVLLTPKDTDVCGPSGSVESGVRLGQVASGLSAAQRANARAVIAEGRRRRLPDRAIVIALAVAHQESGFLNYANDGRGGDLQFTQVGIEQSLQLPHQAVGSDHGSLGVFQQQWPWWGTLHQLMDPRQAAGKFYRALLAVPGWARMPVTVAAQRVQRSAYPSAYADDEPLARALLRGAQGTPSTTQSAVFTGRVTTNCLDDSSRSGAGMVVFPLPSGSGYHDQRNWGGEGARWMHGHTGTDLSVACGTPVRAATAGTVVIRTDQSWAGRWLVQVSTGSGRLTTWYAHMRRVSVLAGQRVRAGQQIGDVGDLGNATGCHLHFEVHPHGGSIYQDNVNPTTWLAEHVGKGSSHHTMDVSQRSSAGLPSFVLATFNTLGSSHTGPHGNKPWMTSGPRRTRGLVMLLQRHRVGVAGLQEFQRPQQRAFVRLAGDDYAVYSPARNDTDNSIVWRRESWQLVSARPVPIPYFDGHPRPMSLVRLRSRTTGALVTFLNVHNPADTRRFHRQGRWRSAALHREVALVHRLQAAGRQVFVTGDMNDRRTAFCAFTRRGRLQSPVGTARGAGCHAPRHAGIDWLFGSAGARFVGYRLTRGPLVDRTTDHPLVSVGVTNRRD